MKLFAMVPALVLGAAGLVSEPVELATEYRAGTKIRTEAESTSQVEVTDLSGILNGQELPRQALAGMERSLTELTTNGTAFIDSFLDVEDGRPTRLERTFEAVTRVAEKADKETEEAGVLEGRTIELSEDDEGEVSAKVADEGEEPDEDYLEKHRLTFLADFLLPADPVDVGDSWAIDEESAKRVVGLGGGPRVFASDERRTNAMDEILESAGEVSMEVTFEAIEDHDDLRCAHLTFETNISAELDELPGSFTKSMGELDESSGAVELEVTVEGEAWFALAERRPVELVEELSGTLFIEMRLKGGPEGQKREIAIDIDASLGGTNRQRWTLAE